ncbi:Phosphoribosyl transferase domain-containing protein [Epibacterium ulvae]|uniref:Phosphoribosyl transferase domain-containing protein n=1 Tax=Epibacterium ulvae TaxID=1156985 RepID=A0A1G5QEJ6_9RHOB|nr:HAD family hydrolase [Epibacterium ulvae]SCZ60026.1 Phosphoribosyl transferase domain-containing protein [Epibacterium ulvae]
MHTLRGAIFSLRNVLAREGEADQDTIFETVKLIEYLISVGVQPVLVSNSTWTMVGTKEPFNDYFSRLVGQELPYYQGGRDMEYKQYAAAMQHVLENHGWTPQEVVYIGNTQEDIQAASNGGLLLLNAKWHEANSPFGFEFNSPKDIAKFVDCCCLTPGDWFWGIEDGDLRVYTIAPLGEYSRAYPDAATYSTDAKNAVKFGLGDLRFWGLLMAARMHLSGIGAEASYVVPYPGHKTTSKKAELMQAVSIAAGSLRARYLQDYVIRHQNAPKSQESRNKGLQPSADNQLSTIHLRSDPLKTGAVGGRYKSRPNVKDKTILMVDDICTQGHSLEAARAFAQAAGASVISLCWLKTPGPNDYNRITGLKPPLKKPFTKYVPAQQEITVYSNSGQVINQNAAKQIADAFTRFRDWEWP